MNFLGYRRQDGRVGTRNYVGVLSTVVCANEAARAIAGQVKGAVAFSHQQGCCQTPPDLSRVTQALSGLGRNPNLAAVVLVGLGCEGTDVAQVAKAIADCGKPVQVIALQEEGGAAKTTAKGVLIAQQMAVEASRIRRVECPLSDLVLGLKCGSSDTTSGLAANPAVGVAVERPGGGGCVRHHGRSDGIHRRRAPPGPPVQRRKDRAGNPAVRGPYGAAGQGHGRRYARRPAHSRKHQGRAHHD